MSNSIKIKLLSKPTFYKDVKVVVLNIEVTNKCFLTKKNLSLFVLPSENCPLINSFEQSLFAENESESFSAYIFPVNPIINDFISTFTLKGRQSMCGHIIIEMKEYCPCFSIQVLSSAKKVLSELAINERDYMIELSNIEQTL